MSAAAPTTPPDAKPSRSAGLIALIRKLIDYGRELADTLHQRVAADPRFARRSYGITDLALILLRIRRGLMRASALEQRLVQNAARLDAPRKPRPARSPGQPQHQAAGQTRRHEPAMRQAEDLNAPFELPTEQEIAAWVRRRPIGSVLADICRDLGITCDHPLWSELRDAIMFEGGDCFRWVMEIIDRVSRCVAELWFPPAPIAPPVPAGTGPP